MRCVAGTIYRDGSSAPQVAGEYDHARRAEGRDVPELAHTMIGLRRLENLRRCVESSLRDGVPGDLMETGVWRGGACIFMRAILVAHGVVDRRVIVADSFAGVPPPDAERYPADRGIDFTIFPQLAVSLETVKANFAAYGLLDEHVVFVPGWFRETLPAFASGPLAVLRLDGDLYESTILALDALYPRVSPGGYVIVDDYGAVPACRSAVDDYRAAHGVDVELETIDWTGVYWRKPP